MGSLYEATNKVRKFIVVFLLLILVFIGYDTFSGLAQGEPETALNEANRFYMSPDRALGDIPKPVIKGIEIDTDNSVSFSIESVHSNFTDAAYVYAIEKPRQKLNSFEDALESAEILGFVSDSFEEIGDNNVKWQADSNTKSLTYNKVLQTWQMTTAYFSNVNALAPKKMSEDINDYAGRIVNLVNRMGFTSKGLTNGKAEIKFARIGVDGEFVDVDNSNEAEYVSIDLFRELPFSDLKPSAERPVLQTGQEEPEPVIANVYTSDSRFGQFHVIGSNQMQDFEKDVFELKFNNIDYGNSGKYLIITPDEAWTKVQRGEGALVELMTQGENYFAERKSENVQRYIADARRTEIGYFEPETWDGFVYPIYIFHGRAELENGRQASFTFYVDAIKRLT